MKITTHVGAVDAVGDAVGDAVVVVVDDDISTYRPPITDPKIVMASP